LNLENINKFLVVGFEENSLKNVSLVFDKLGLKVANASKNEKLTPNDISKTILKSKIRLNKKISIEQEKVSQVWNTLALDFFMGNLENEYYYWSDTKVLPLLDFWKKIDDQLAFVLVYDEPHKALKRYLEGLKEGEFICTDELLEKYKAYNQAMLNFFYQNQDKAFLIHANAIGKIRTNYLELFKNKIGFDEIFLNSDIDDTKHINIELVEPTQKNDNSSSISYIIDEILNERADVLDLYEQMQSVANIYSQNKLQTRKKASDALSELLSLKHSKQNSLKSLLQKDEALKDVQQELKQLKKIYGKQKTELSDSEEKSFESKKENELLLNQIMNVQEELEKYYLENKKLESEKLNLEQELDKELEISKQKAEPNKKLEISKQQEKILQKQNQELEEKLKNIPKLEKQKKELTQQAQLKNKELKEENELLLNQIMNIQEELEKYYIENNSLKEKKAKIKKYYGAAERIKSQLSYRLGSKMIEKSKTFGGVLTLPFSLMAVYSDYKKDMKARRGKKLPHIESYADAYDAQKVKKHLSFMLGESMIKTMKTNFGIFTLPFALKKTYKKFKTQIDD